MNDRLQRALVDRTGPLSGSSIESVQPVSGGCIHQAWRLKLSDGRMLFVKSGSAQAMALFEVEAEALKALHKHADPELLVVPKPLKLAQLEAGAVMLLPWLTFGGGDQSSLGRGLALLHRSSAESAEDRYGWDRDGYIGAGPQPGGWRDSWGDAFVELRLRPQLEQGLCQWGMESALLERLLTVLARQLNQLAPAASLVHGDLWGGNADSLQDGRGTIFDPASWWADSEVDLAMTKLFGGFSTEFRTAYEEVVPARPGAEERIEIYNLYHLLNHANLFGGGYVGQCRASLKGLARQWL